MENNWSIQEAWNKTITVPKKWEPYSRNYLYASEIGRSLFDVYHSMIGTEPTEQLSDTARRKMEAGNFYESIVVWVFKRTGILIDTQTRVRWEKLNMLPVSGKIDILAGCDGNWRERKKELIKLFAQLSNIGFDFPFLEQVKKLSTEIIDNLSEKYPEGLENKIYEVKSLNSMAFWRDDKPISIPYQHHINQGTIYQRFNNFGVDKLNFLYIDRDTMSVSELPNIIKEENIKMMEEWIEKMSYHYKNKTEPPKPELIIWDKREEKWSYNWEVDRSSYKKLIIGDKKPESIIEEVNSKNKLLRERSLMKDAKEGNDRFGTKKYKLAIEMLKQGISLGEVEKKTGAPIHALKYYKEEL